MDCEPLLPSSLVGDHRQVPLADEGLTDALAVCGDLSLLPTEIPSKRVAFQRPLIGRFPLVVAERAYMIKREFAVFELNVGNLVFAQWVLPLGLELFLLVGGDYQNGVGLAVAQYDSHVPGSEEGGHALDLLKAGPGDALHILPSCKHFQGCLLSNGLIELFRNR